MTRYIGRRVGLAILTLFLISVLVFAGTQMLPGNVAARILGPFATQEAIDRQFEIAVKRLADDLRYGSDLSPYAGSGVDYLQSRPFVDGDPVNLIDPKGFSKLDSFA